MRLVVSALLVLTLSTIGRAWGAQGHRVVALIAEAHLTAVARQGVRWLLGSERLADVSSWADQYLGDHYQTSYWHFVNIPPDASGYDRDRDCPRQPGVAAGTIYDRWRDCVVDRIDDNSQRLANPSLDRADRAIALKFLVHLVADLHQPFHAIGVERGGNGIPVSVFGTETCGNTASPRPCNLHGVWDTELIAHRRLDDAQYVVRLEQLIRTNHWTSAPPGAASGWAMQSMLLAKAALLPPHGSVDDAYFQSHIASVDERLALAGVRLSALINAALTVPPPREKDLKNEE